jgi:hypothetical protein
MSQGARSLCEAPVGFPAGGALLGKLSPWGLIALEAGSPVWANTHACALAGCADLPELARCWRKFARGWADPDGLRGAEPAGGIVDKTSLAGSQAFRYEIHPIPEAPGSQLVVLKGRHEFSDHDATIVLAGERRLATLYASQVAHDVRGGASESRMALAAVDALLKVSAAGLAHDVQQMLADRMASAVAGCLRSTAAVDAWSADLHGTAVPDGNVDLREIARRLSKILLLPFAAKLISCDIEPGEAARMATGSERALRNGLACLGLHLLERALEDTQFTLRFESAGSAHAILMSVDALEDPGDPLDPDRAMLWIEDRALVPFYAGRLLLEAQGATLSPHEVNGSVGFRITIPAAVPRRESDRTNPPLGGSDGRPQ